MFMLNGREYFHTATALCRTERAVPMHCICMDDSIHEYPVKSSHFEWLHRHPARCNSRWKYFWALQTVCHHTERKFRKSMRLQGDLIRENARSIIIISINIRRLKINLIYTVYWLPFARCPCGRFAPFAKAASHYGLCLQEVERQFQHLLYYNFLHTYGSMHSIRFVSIGKSLRFFSNCQFECSKWITLYVLVTASH